MAEDITSVKEKEPMAEKKFVASFKVAQKPLHQQPQGVLNRQQQQQPIGQQQPAIQQQPPQQFPSMQPPVPQLPQQLPVQQQPVQQQPVPQKEIPDKLKKAQKKAFEAVLNLEQLVARMRENKHPDLQDHERRLLKLKKSLAEATTEQAFLSVELLAKQGVEHNADSVANTVWNQVETAHNEGSLNHSTYSSLSKMCQKGAKDNYQAFCKSAKAELGYVNLQKDRWHKISPDGREKSDEAQELGWMLDALDKAPTQFDQKGKAILSRMAKMCKEAKTLWSDAEEAAVDKKDFKLAADLGEKLIELHAYLKAEHDSSEQTFQLAHGNPKKMKELVDKPMEQVRQLEQDLGSVVQTAYFKKSGKATADDAAQLLVKFEEMLKTSDATYLRKALKDLGVLRQEWSKYQTQADTWDKEKGQRQRECHMLIALRSLAQEQKYPAYDELNEFVLEFLRRMQEAESLDRGTLESKIRAAELAAIVMSKFDAAATNARGKYQEYCKQQLMTENDAKIKDKKRGPEAKMAEAFEVVYEGDLPKTLLKAQQLKFAAQNSGGPKIPEKMTLAHVTALNLYTQQFECMKMQEVLRGNQPGQKPMNEDYVEAFTKLIDLAEEALKMLPQYTGETKRGESAWPGAEQQYVVNNKFKIKAFWSTAFGSGAFDGTYQITIRPQPKKGGGRQIDAFSHFFKENEVLYPPGSEFKVLSVTGELKTGFRVLVQEV